MFLIGSMKNVRVFLSENSQFLEVKFSIYLNRRVFVMITIPILPLLYNSFFLSFTLYSKKHTPYTTYCAFNTLRKHAYSNILKILSPKNENFLTKKKSDIFQISAQNIDCGYSLGSNEYPQSMF